MMYFYDNYNIFFPRNEIIYMGKNVNTNHGARIHDYKVSTPPIELGWFNMFELSTYNIYI